MMKFKLDTSRGRIRAAPGLLFSRNAILVQALIYREGLELTVCLCDLQLFTAMARRASMASEIGQNRIHE